MKATPPASNIEWKAWARKDPLYAVSTCPDRDREGERPWTDEEFYSIGRSDWEDFRSHWQLYGCEPGSCLEIGCGAGRITQYMAKDFAAVHACDISEDMLAYARKHVHSPNVTFHLTSGAELPAANGEISGVFSCHVFQHFDSLQTASTYFAEIRRILSDRGSLMIHLPIYCWPNALPAFDWVHRVHSRISDWKAGVNRRMIQAGFFRPLMRRLAYPVEWLFAELGRLGFEDVRIDIIPLKSTGDPHPFVLARKRAAAEPGQAVRG